MSSTLLARQIFPLLAHAGHESYSVVLFHSSPVRSSDSRRQQRHVHFKGSQFMLRPLPRRTFVFASAVAAGFTTALILHTFSMKKSHYWPMCLLKAWLKTKWAQLCLWPERLRIWAKHKWSQFCLGRVHAKGSKKWWRAKIARKDIGNRKRTAAKRRKQKWVQRERKGFAKGKRLFQQGPKRKKQADDGSMDTEEDLNGEGKEGKTSKQGERGVSKE